MTTTPLGARSDEESIVAAFTQAQPFGLDAFQRQGIAALARGRSTLVAAPTGAGKTVVGEFAVWRALALGGKCFYTTPIKALSNQKHHDLVARHGQDRVGLLTGDRVVNPEAPVVVMTTEVLRNMLYEVSPTLDGLHAVVLDEVHYLADRARGAVWEEVIIQLDPAVQLACLSATVSNAEELGEWLRLVRPGPAGAGDGAMEPAGGPTASSCEVVISEHRPVPLEHSYAIGEQLYDTFRSGLARAGGKGGAGAAKAKRAKRAQGGVPNPEVVMLERCAQPSGRPSRSGRRQPGGARLRPPRRSVLVTGLRDRRWLPVIYFLFSRNGCDDAVQQVLRDGVRLTSGGERAAIHKLVTEHTTDLAPDDLAALGFDRWLRALEHGVAAHHAGMVPAFKEVVEALFVRGLVKVCFATETLALGINMPARTVVIERLEKWNGQSHELLTAGQLTQLTGRAGRRGLDPLGHAVIAYQRDVDFGVVASLVGRRTERLRSSFAPSYNMAVNLLRRHDRAAAQALLSRSFAQHQADAGVVDLEAQIARNRTALEGYGAHLASEVGDFADYWALRRELSDTERRGATERRRRGSEAVTDGLAALTPGDVIVVGKGERSELAAVVATSATSDGTPLVRVLTASRRTARVGPRELGEPPRPLGVVDLPSRGGPREASWRRQVAAELREARLEPEPPHGEGAPDDPGEDRASVRQAQADRVEALRARLRAHPVHTDPALPQIEVWAHRHDELAAETERLERQLRRRTGSLVRAFERIVALLVDLGYLADDEDHPRPTPDGDVLATVYAETDLVLVESLRAGLLDGLDAPDLAAVASVFVHQTRLKDPPEVRLPSASVADRIAQATKVWTRIQGMEEAAGLSPTRPLDQAFAAIVWRWASGADLDDALAATELTAGDFVRSVKQVADLLRQLRDATRGRGLADRAHEAARALDRGVVALD